MMHTQTMQQAVDRILFRFFDSRLKICSRFLTKALQLGDLVVIQPIDISQITYPAQFVESLDNTFTEARTALRRLSS